MTRTEKITKWIKALRSGRYKQGRGALVIFKDSESCYCCLGVAEKVCKMPENFDGRLTGSTVTYPELSAWLEITARQEERLIRMNDKLQKNFSEIADYIEKEIA